MSDRAPPSKRDVALALLEGLIVRVHLDPRCSGVTVPPRFKRQPQLVLEIGLNLPVPIPDLDIGDEGITCTLSFDRRPCWCRMPWPAVFALVGDDGRGMVWPDDVPPELAVTSQRPTLKAVPRSGSTAAARQRRRKRQGDDQEAVTSLDELREERLRDGDEGLDEPAFEDGDAALRITGHRPPPLRAVPKPDPSTDDSSHRRGGEDDDSDPDDGRRKLPPYLRVIK